MERMRQPRLGIDIGRVIIDGGAHPDGALDSVRRAGRGLEAESLANADTAFFQGDEATMLATPEMAGAVETIAALTVRFDGRVWLVSKCGPRVEARTRRWLAGHDFFDRTGIEPDHLRFCRERADKRVHCVELGLTHFVDDRIEVHEAIRDVVEHRYLFGSQRPDRPGGGAPAPGYVTPVPDWPTARRLIEATLHA
jgi:hypothetical protein